MCGMAPMSQMSPTSEMCWAEFMSNKKIEQKIEYNDWGENSLISSRKNEE